MTPDTLGLGFVGFGAMPRRMAARLCDAAYAVIAFDVAHDLAQAALEPEIDWLRAEIYDFMADAPCRRLTAFDRYPERA